MVLSFLSRANQSKVNANSLSRPFTTDAAAKYRSTPCGRHLLPPHAVEEDDGEDGQDAGGQPLH